MTDREIKLELSKAALAGGMEIETAKAFYDWITEEPAHKLPEDKSNIRYETPIEELAHKTKMEGTIIKRCKDNGINTIGDLIRCGAHKFRTFHNVGGSTITKIDAALEEHYGISDWYTT